jgi:hypothetical protein
MSKGCIYYTDNRLDVPIFSICQEHIKASGLPITSVSLKPIDFGNNIVLDNLQPNIITMTTQILTALENAKEDYVFFTEHDVLYHPSHFDFTPPTDNIWYYNNHVWRWKYPYDFAITYKLTSLSGLCVNRKMAIDHYKLRLKFMYECDWRDKESGHEPRWGRRIGYEPGTKKRRRGGLTDEEHLTWKSELPNIDIRHGNTFTKTKCDLRDFIHKPSPEDWKEKPAFQIEGWNLKKLFNL